MTGFAFARRSTGFAACRRPALRNATLCAALCALGLGGGATASRAASISPPMLDITHQCDTSTRHNMRAMSECVVAESEARAEILQKWDHVSDATAEKCVTLGRKSRRLPYSAIARCIAVEPVALPAAPVPAAPAPAAAEKEKPTFSSWKQFFSSGK